MKTSSAAPTLRHYLMACVFITVAALALALVALANGPTWSSPGENLAGIFGRMLHKPKVIAAFTRAARRLGQYEYRPPQQ